MSDPSRDLRIQHLKKLKSDLAEDYAALNQSRNEIVIAHLVRLEAIRDAKRQQLQEWADNERTAALRERDGQYSEVDSNYEERMREVNTRVSDFLAFKIKLLREKFPGPAQYFEGQGYVWPAVDSQPPPPPHYPNDLEIKLSDEPLFSPSEIAEDIQLITRMSAHPADGRVLLGRLGPGARVNLQMPGVPAIPGVLGPMTEEYVEFTTESGKTLKISFRALELKYAAITA
jgi:hypothetical protein